jgi:hypothetical protein
MRLAVLKTGTVSPPGASMMLDMDNVTGMHATTASPARQ